MTAKRPAARALTVALLLVLFARLSFASRELSFTSDEPSHIATGYAYLARGATWTVPLRGHPPLLDAWLALPIYIGDPTVPVESLAGWEADNTTYVKAFVPALRQNVLRAEVASRTPVMLLTVLLAAVVARWAGDIAGAPATALGLLALVSDPTLLAHGMLATNDVGVTALGSLGLFLTYRLLRRTTQARVLAAGVALGLTMLAKGSGIIWLTAALLMVACEALQRTRSRRPLEISRAPQSADRRYGASHSPSPIKGSRNSLLSTPSLKTDHSPAVSLAQQRTREGHQCLLLWNAVTALGISAGVSAVAIVCIWLCYGLEWGPLTLGSLSLAVPAPTHWQSILTQSSGAGERVTYFLGTVRRGGHWAYFPVAAFVKNPVPLLTLSAWGLACSLRDALRCRRTANLWPFPVLYTASAIVSGVNIGYRHMLPIHTFLYLLVAQVPWARLSRKLVVGALAGWLVVESLITAPHFLSYASPLIGGPEQGWRYLADSNTDWGQGYKAIQSHMEIQAGSRPVRFSGPEGYIGAGTYGMRYRAIPPIPSNPDPIMLPDLYPAAGAYAISANSLSGLGLIAPDNYAWFRYHEPTRFGAGAIYFFDVPPLPADTWLAQCSTPATPLNAEGIARRFAAEPARTVAFDCTQAWITPGPMSGTGWYTVHDQALAPTARFRQRLGYGAPQAQNAFLGRRLSGLRVGYRQWDYRETPAFVLFNADIDRAATPAPLDAYVATSGSTPADLSEARELPVGFAGPLSLTGIAVYERDGVLEAETWWHVTTVPTGRPLSVMAHLLQDDGAPVGVADGFGITPTDLAVGDTVVQLHTFPAPEDGRALWLRVGVYWSENTELWEMPGETGNAVYVQIDQARVR